MTWEPWVKTKAGTPNWTPEEQARVAEQFGCTVADVRGHLLAVLDQDVYVNNVYQVHVRKSGDDLIHLSIKRVDKMAVHDWRDLQRIKNELVGPEHEAVELYPAESRLVDTANQYHLWVLTDPTERLQIGFFDGRKAFDDILVAGVQQRAFEPGEG